MRRAVKVDSWNPDWSGFHFERERWIDVWDRSEVNPSEYRDHDDSVSSSDGLIVEPLAINTRIYVIWVMCRVGVNADPGFAVSTYATSSIGCHVPYFVVEEIVNF